MPSKAMTAFYENARDIERLLELHKQKGGTQRGRRFGLEVLNKSAIVLITSFWEAYCEDVATEGLNHIIQHTKNANGLPKELRKTIAKDLKEDLHELRIWDLADDGWRDVLRNRARSLMEARNRKLNTPRATNIDELFFSALGIDNISSAWQWAKKMTDGRARQKLDRLITLRGEIAHRGGASKSVTKAQVVDYFEFIKKVASKTGGRVNKHVYKVTGKPLWPNLKLRLYRSSVISSPP
jgi:hypothetical protein